MQNRLLYDTFADFPDNLLTGTVKDAGTRSISRFSGFTN